MLKTTRNALCSPIIGRVIELNKYVFQKRTIPEKTIQNAYVKPLLVQCELLFTQALRELRGKDYLKRALETIEAIQSKNYLIHAMKGWNIDVTTFIDAACDDIVKQLYAIDNKNKAGVTKSKDESE
ncbi:MAG: hypothetical protein II708_01510 [Paludibacteraceae bacterium]|jgi:hypothetical protein|nr:hypothetical protein [Paludibacteraceae bacterium]